MESSSVLKVKENLAFFGYRSSAPDYGHSLAGFKEMRGDNSEQFFLLSTSEILLNDKKNEMIRLVTLFTLGPACQ